MYRRLNPEKTIDTVHTLHKRITERFPDSGLGKVCEELHRATLETMQRSAQIARPDYRLRLLTATVIVGIIAVLFYSISLMELTFSSIDAGELVQIIEAGLNDVVLIGAAIFFLVSTENRHKRQRTLVALHELRAIAHVIDMHQLTKDPNAYTGKVIFTESSPRPQLSIQDLTLYLDYCSEMLSLTGKVAALYAQNFHDAQVISVVNEVESLTTGLSRKIWQKIMILQRLAEEPEHC